MAQDIWENELWVLSLKMKVWIFVRPKKKGLSHKPAGISMLITFAALPYALNPSFFNCLGEENEKNSRVRIAHFLYKKKHST